MRDGNAKDCGRVEGWRKRKVWSEGRRGEERGGEGRRRSVNVIFMTMVVMMTGCGVRRENRLVTYLEAGKAGQLVQQVRCAIASLSHPVTLHAVDPQAHDTAFVFGTHVRMELE